MTKKEISDVLLLFVLVLSIIAFGVLYFITKPYSVQSETTTVSDTSTTQVNYKISVYDGRIAVFDTSTNSPIEVFDVYLSSLPQSEQNQIRSGIYTDSSVKLQELIEDYTS